VIVQREFDAVGQNLCLGLDRVRIGIAVNNQVLRAIYTQSAQGDAVVSAH